MQRPGIIRVYPPKKKQQPAAVTFAPPPAPVAPPAPALPPRIARVLEELMAWRKRVNLKLQQEKITKEFLQELLQELRAARLDNKKEAPAPAPSLPTLGEPTLQVRTKGTATTLYSLPERTSRVVEYVSPDTALQLYEPWTENSAGIWMRVKSGAWFQLWDRSTNTYFAE